MLHKLPFATSFAQPGRMPGAAVRWTLAVLILTGCSAQGLSPTAGEPSPGAATEVDATSGCPTPSPSDDLGLEHNGSSAGQSAQAAATSDENTVAGEQGMIPSLAAREAMLDRANQGPPRPEARAEDAIAAPDPSLALTGDTAAVSATLPMSDSTGLSADGATPTPCP